MPDPSSETTPVRPPDLAGDVIDVEARVIQDVADPLGPPPPSPPPPAEATPTPTSGFQDEAFLAGCYKTRSVSLDYRLYVPPGDPMQPRPLVLMLHGCTQGSLDFAAGTRMNELARQQGWLVLYPEQSRRTSPQRCWSWFKASHQQRGRGEPAWLMGLVHGVMQAHRVDARHVHIAGLSAGGAMAALLGRAYPELFASIGVHSGLPAGVAKDAAGAMALMKDGRGPARIARAQATHRAPPAIVFHGTRDLVVHPRNGEAVALAARNGEDGPQDLEQATEGGRRYTRTIYRGPDGGVRSELWLIDGAGHAWSGGSAEGSHADATGPDASAQMLRFFNEHPLDR